MSEKLRTYISGPITKGILLDNIQQADTAMAEAIKLCVAAAQKDAREETL